MSPSIDPICPILFSSFLSYPFLSFAFRFFLYIYLSVCLSTYPSNLSNLSHLSSLTNLSSLSHLSLF
jgi:hypothetical protein